MKHTHTLELPKAGDFLVDQKFVFEIGGRSKGYKQIAEQKDAFIVKDGIEIGAMNVIPLWLFGFLY